MIVSNNICVYSNYSTINPIRRPIQKESRPAFGCLVSGEEKLSEKSIDLMEKFCTKYDFKKQKPIQYAAKRVIDVAVGTVGLILSSPAIGISAAIVKMDSKGPAIYKQVRLGKKGSKFIIYKLRTMKDSSPIEENLKRAIDDPRITRTGKILRKYSIDELPQFLNILKGDMSLVGPRPLSYTKMKLMTDVDPNSIRRLAVKPGASLGYSTEGTANASKKIKTEEDYLNHWSLFEDLKHLGRIIKQVTTGKNL